MNRSRPLLLLVDDDPGVVRVLAGELSAEGYDAVTAPDGLEGMALFEALRPDLVLTELAMPRADGFFLIEAVRASGPTPVLVVSARGAEQDKVRALDLGADDFVTKPFSVPALLARVRAQLRHVSGGARLLEFEGLVIDRERRLVRQEGRHVHLTPTEFAILELLALSSGRPVSILQLATLVWKGAPAASADTVRVHVGSLRRKLEPDPSSPRYIVTEPWVGYRFVSEPVR